MSLKPLITFATVYLIFFSLPVTAQEQESDYRAPSHEEIVSAAELLRAEIVAAVRYLNDSPANKVFKTHARVDLDELIELSLSLYGDLQKTANIDYYDTLHRIHDHLIGAVLAVERYNQEDRELKRTLELAEEAGGAKGVTMKYAVGSLDYFPREVQRITLTTLGSELNIELKKSPANLIARKALSTLRFFENSQTASDFKSEISYAEMERIIRIFETDASDIAQVWLLHLAETLTDLSIDLQQAQLSKNRIRRMQEHIIEQAKVAGQSEESQGSIAKQAGYRAAQYPHKWRKRFNEYQIDKKRTVITATIEAADTGKFRQENPKDFIRRYYRLHPY